MLYCKEQDAAPAERLDAAHTFRRLQCIYGECLCRDIIVELNVGKGDTLEKLAEMYHIPVEKMLAANEGRPTHALTGAMALSLDIMFELIVQVPSNITCAASEDVENML